MLKAKDSRKRVGEGKSRGRRGAAVVAQSGAKSPDLWEILGRFDRALSLVVVAHRSLAAKESAEVGDEEEELRRGIRMLKDVHKELDLGAVRIERQPTKTM